MTNPPIEDYALIGDCRSAALVNRAGAIDWLCWPRFDSPSCFAALLGSEENGRWLLAPTDASATVTRRYLPDTLVLETVFSTPDGEVAVLDFMPVGGAHSHIVRLVQGRRGRVPMRLHLTVRFDYGSAIPWVTRLPDGLQAVAGPDRVVLRTPVATSGEGFATVARFTVAAGETVPFVLSYGVSHEALPPAIDAAASLPATIGFWAGWAARSTYHGPHKAAVTRSLITLKALTYAPTGGMVAAPTTSLPEAAGGSRNWDYRYCWLRDTAMTLQAFMHTGHSTEAQAWSDWLHRAAAGRPDDLRIMYGLAGERRLPEWEAESLPGYQGAKPVRIGNGAAGQLQLDVFGEVLDALHQARRGGLTPGRDSWNLQIVLIQRLEAVWDRPDEGIWEVRGGRRHFTFSKLMAWVAMDAAISSAETFGLSAPLERWRAVRAAIHADVCRNGFDANQNSFTQSYGVADLDASLLLMPRFGFLPIDDPRVIGTITAIERELLQDGLVLRYRAADGLPPGEATFLPCSFWLAEAYVSQGRHADAAALFDRLLGLRNDVGLLAEEYDPVARRQMGNFPQALTHTALITTALALKAAI